MTIPDAVAEQLMRRALELAKQGLGFVEPNPAVGAIVVDDSGAILGEGWHQKYGGPHAEVHALAAAGEAARGATLFVTLEPCCHYGKTPPCSKAVIAAGIRRVYVATQDPAPHVDGGGIDELRQSGIEVEVGLLGDEARLLIAPFVQLVTKHRPWFHGKWAMTLDGKIASRTGHSQWISNSQSRAIVHQLRGRMDGVLVGIGTVLADDPMLTARPAGPRNATRIILDSLARLPLDSQLVRTAAQIPVIDVVTSNTPEDRIKALREAGVEVLVVSRVMDDKLSLTQLADELGRRRMTNILVEGGQEILGGFFDAKLIDEVHAFIAPKLVGGTTAKSPIGGFGLEQIPELSSIESPSISLIEQDIYVNGPLRR